MADSDSLTVGFLAVGVAVGGYLFTRYRSNQAENPDGAFDRATNAIFGGQVLPQIPDVDLPSYLDPNQGPLAGDVTGKISSTFEGFADTGENWSSQIGDRFDAGLTGDESTSVTDSLEDVSSTRTGDEILDTVTPNLGGGLTGDSQTNIVDEFSPF